MYFQQIICMKNSYSKFNTGHNQNSLLILNFGYGNFYYLLLNFSFSVTKTEMTLPKYFSFSYGSTKTTLAS